MHKMNFGQRIRDASEHADKPNGSVVLLIGIAIVLAWLLEPILARAIL
jgi:hypothetical protein